MPYVPVPNVAMVELRQLLDAQQIENTLYFDHGAVIAPVDLVELAATVGEWWLTDMRSLITASVLLNEVFVTDLTTDTSGIASFTTGLPAPGLQPRESMPGNVAACISFHTANRGRSFRGRNYISGMAEQEVSLSTLAGTWMTSVVEVYDALRSQVEAIGWTQVVVSRYSGYTIVGAKKKPIGRAVGLATPVISSSFTDNTVDSQRNRLPNH